MRSGEIGQKYLWESSCCNVQKDLPQDLRLYSIIGPLWSGDVAETAETLESNSHRVGWLVTGLVTRQTKNNDGPWLSSVLSIWWV